MTIALQASWLLFVGGYWALAAIDGEMLTVLRVLSYNGSFLGMFAGIIFSITPVVTIPALRRKTRPLLISAAACNTVSLLYGIAIFVGEADLTNEMVALAVAMPLITSIAATVSLVSIASSLGDLRSIQRRIQVRRDKQ